MRRHLGLGHEYGKLVHPNEWDSDDQPRYDHSFPPLALGGETADVTHPDSRDFLDLRVNAAETELSRNSWKIGPTLAAHPGQSVILTASG